MPVSLPSIVFSVFALLGLVEIAGCLGIQDDLRSAHVHVFRSPFRGQETVYASAARALRRSASFLKKSFEETNLAIHTFCFFVIPVRTPQVFFVLSF